MATKERTPAEVLTLLSQAGLRPFDKGDWQAWSGCESENPLYGEINHPNPDGSIDGHTIVIVDGDKIWVQDISSNWRDVSDEGRTYTLTGNF